MPVIVESGQERVVGEAEYAAMQQQIKAERLDRMETSTREGEDSIAVWDCVEGGWSGPFPEEHVYKKYLKKEVLKCSACTWTYPFGAANIGRVKAHVENVQEQAQAHYMAQIDDDGKCSGCGNTFSARKLQAQKHLETMRGLSETHQTVEALIFRRYSLEPSEPRVISRSLITSGAQGTGSERSKVVPFAKERRRRRRRRR